MADGGWYIDEHDPELVRWHDGAGWTDFVLLRAEWEEAGEAPPPPEDLDWGPSGSGWPRRVVGPVVVLLVLAVIGLAVIDDGGSGDPAVSSSDSRQEEVRDQGRLGSGPQPTVVDPDDPLADGSPAGDATDPTTVGSRQPAGRSTASTTAPRAGASGGVQRTETSSRTQTNPGPITQGGGTRDESHVGNRSATTITGTIPPTSAPASTVPDSTSPGPTDPPPSDPPPGPGDL